MLPAFSLEQTPYLRSPIAGNVVDKKINNGQEVRPDMILGSTSDVITPLFTIADPSRLWVLLDVPETDLNELKGGQEVELRTPAILDGYFQASWWR